MNRIFNKIVMMMAILLSAVSLAGNAQEKVIQAYDYEEESEFIGFPGHVWKDTETKVGGNVNYTDKVGITLDGNKELGVLFLSEDTREVALTSGRLIDLSAHLNFWISEPLPDYIEYKGIQYKVVELRGTGIRSKHLILPNTIRNLERGSINDVESIQLSEGLENIDSDAFFGDFTRLRELKFPKSLRRIYPQAITGYTYPGLDALGETYALHTIDFSPNTYMIGRDNFNNFIEVEDIVLPYKLSELGENCFNNLKSLKKVQIGNFIGGITDCFNDCPNIEEIIIDGWFGLKVENSFNAVDKSKCVVKVKTLTHPEGYPLYDSDFWKDFKIVEIDASGVETIINDPANGVYNTRWYDLSGRPLSSIDGLKRGEIYIECQGSKSEKKIMD